MRRRVTEQPDERRDRTEEMHTLLADLDAGRGDFVESVLALREMDRTPTSPLWLWTLLNDHRGRRRSLVAAYHANDSWRGCPGCEFHDGPIGPRSRFSEWPPARARANVRR